MSNIVATPAVGALDNHATHKHKINDIRAEPFMDNMEYECFTTDYNNVSVTLEFPRKTPDKDRTAIIDDVRSILTGMLWKHIDEVA